MLLQSLWVLCWALGGAGSIWNGIRSLVWSTTVSGRLVNAFLTDLHFSTIVADEVYLDMGFSSVAAATICQLLIQMVVVGLVVSCVWECTNDEWVKIVQNNDPGCIVEAQRCHPWWRVEFVSCCHFVILINPPLGNAALTTAIELILVVTIPRVAEWYTNFVYKMLHGTYFALLNSLDTEVANLTYCNLNSTMFKPDKRWNIRLVVYSVQKSWVKHGSNGNPLKPFMDVLNIQWISLVHDELQSVLGNPDEGNNCIQIASHGNTRVALRHWFVLPVNIIVVRCPCRFWRENFNRTLLCRHNEFTSENSNAWYTD